MGAVAEITIAMLQREEQRLREAGTPTHPDGYYVLCAHTVDAWTLKQLRGKYPLRRETMVSMAPQAWASAQEQWPGCELVTIVGSSLVVRVGNDKP